MTFLFQAEGPMNLSFLRTFLEVVDAGNLNRAAERLHVTQSTVTTRINALEEQLGQQLLLRNKSGTALTSAGFKFQRYAELMVQLWRQANHEISLPDTFSTICNIGCHFDLWHDVGQQWFDGIRQNHPEIAFSVWGGDQTEMDRWVASGLVDVALCYSANVRDNAFARLLFEDPLVLVSSASPHAPYPDPPHLYVDLGEDFRRQHAAVFPNAAAPAMIFGTAAWALDHLLNTGGTGYLPLSMASSALKDGSLLRVEVAPVFSRAVYLVGDATTVRSWSWFDASIEEISQTLQEAADRALT